MLFLQEVPTEKGAKPGFQWKLVGDYMTNKGIDGISGSTGTFTLAFHSRDKRPGKPETADAGAAGAPAVRSPGGRNQELATDHINGVYGEMICSK